MNKYPIVVAAMLAGLLSTGAFAEPGEYWEVTSRTEMPGMPMAMPATTVKICVPKGGASDPRKTSTDKACQMTDIKTAGNKTLWKIRCERSGEVTTGSGEQTTTANGYHGKMQFSSKTSGRDISMTSVYSGKRIGGSCETKY